MISYRYFNWQKSTMPEVEAWKQVVDGNIEHTSSQLKSIEVVNACDVDQLKQLIARCWYKNKDKCDSIARDQDN